MNPQPTLSEFTAMYSKLFPNKTVDVPSDQVHRMTDRRALELQIKRQAYEDFLYSSNSNPNL